eukprot:757371-Hanusia_phi.AAC.4
MKRFPAGLFASPVSSFEQLVNSRGRAFFDLVASIDKVPPRSSRWPAEKGAGQEVQRTERRKDDSSLGSSDSAKWQTAGKGQGQLLLKLKLHGALVGHVVAGKTLGPLKATDPLVAYLLPQREFFDAILPMVTRLTSSCALILLRVLLGRKRKIKDRRACFPSSKSSMKSCTGSARRKRSGAVATREEDGTNGERKGRELKGRTGEAGEVECVTR